jgi:hypothetical protein
MVEVPGGLAFAPTCAFELHVGSINRSSWDEAEGKHEFELTSRPRIDA